MLIFRSHRCRYHARFSVGGQVFAFAFGSDFGGRAGYKCMPEDGLIALKPANLIYEEAAAVPGGGMTASLFMIPPTTH